MPIAGYDGHIPIIAPRDHRTRRYSESSSRRPIPLDDRLNDYDSIKPLSINSTLIKPKTKSKYSVDSSEIYFKHEAERHYPKNALYSQEALLEFDRPPTPARIREAIIEIQPKMDKKYKKHVERNPSFKNKSTSPIYNGISLGKEVAISINARPARLKRHDPHMDKYMTALRPLASDVERYNVGRYEDTDKHTQDLRCAEFGSIDLLLRRPEHGRRARSETNGRDSLVRNKFSNRGSTSVSLGDRSQGRYYQWDEACDPFAKNPTSSRRVYGCTHALDAYGIEDNVRTQNRRRRKDPVVFDLSKDDTRERLELLDRGWY